MRSSASQVTRMAKARKTTASTLLRLLAARHSEDIFVPECKNGASYVAKGQMVKMDAWAMKRSWSNPHTYGYEIKVSRADFLKDDKWHRYLELCDHFAFVCPPGVIEKEEVPAEAGLIVSTVNGTKLLTKKKPPRREVELPEDLFRYVLMCRSSIRKEDELFDRQAFWLNWLQNKELSREIGHQCSRALAQVIRKRITEAELENHRLQKENENLQRIAEMCKEIGFPIWSWGSKEMLSEKLADHQATIPSSLRKAVKSLMRSAEEVQRVLAEGDERREAVQPESNGEGLFEWLRSLDPPTCPTCETEMSISVLNLGDRIGDDFDKLRGAEASSYLVEHCCIPAWTCETCDHELEIEGVKERWPKLNDVGAPAAS